jgi:hypothetical protein
MEHRKRAFSNMAVATDGNSYFECTFVRCRLIFRADAPVILEDNVMEDCQWVLDGPALLTLQFLHAFYQDDTDGGRRIADGYIQMIRGATPL